MEECVECYAVNCRATPLLGKRDCLENHEQYLCGTCGRCICSQKDEKRQLQRIDFPFKSLEIAKLYLRVADSRSALWYLRNHQRNWSKIL
ncbi:hypothetical protein ABQD95_10915 [Enterococcus avium]|uniref:hypothetical protein n=1 Tax=Enterococcus avium TaxID=33945 RepID=UPI0028933B5F|nr:hypothetical protein [Enterococcus avium]